MSIDKFRLRILGFSGIVGALMLFAGDMLFYYDSAGTNLKLNMANASDYRIMANGILALLSTWFYLIGTGQVFYAFLPSSKTARNIVAVSFVFILIGYGIVHSAYIAIAATAKVALQNQLDIETATALASNVNHTIRLLIYPLFALLSFVFIRQVWKKKTFYPRWIILFFPLLPFLFKGLISKSLSGGIWIVISGGYLNLMLVVFFTASTIALWNCNPGQDKNCSGNNIN
jgi:hypothetical protein